MPTLLAGVLAAALCSACHSGPYIGHVEMVVGADESLQLLPSLS